MAADAAGQGLTQAYTALPALVLWLLLGVPLVLCACAVRCLGG